MDLDFAILADGASSRPDGKLDLFGAGIDTIWATAAPARHHQITLAIRILFDSTEAAHDHTFEVVLMSSDAEITRLRADIGPVPEEERQKVQPGSQIGGSMIFNLAGIVFPEFGNYHFAFYWDGTELRAPIRLRLAQRD